MFAKHTSTELRLMALAMALKAGFYLHPLVSLAGWGVWLYAVRAHPGVFYRSLVSASLVLLAAAFLVGAVGTTGLNIGPETALPYLLAYLLGLAASAFYAMALLPYLGRWAWLWLLVGFLPHLSFVLAPAMRLVFAYLAYRASREEDKGQDGSQPKVDQPGLRGEEPREVEG